jgi:hypothetical protein
MDGKSFLRTAVQEEQTAAIGFSVLDVVALHDVSLCWTNMCVQMMAVRSCDLVQQFGQVRIDR